MHTTSGPPLSEYKVHMTVNLVQVLPALSSKAKPPKPENFITNTVVTRAQITWLDIRHARPDSRGIQTSKEDSSPFFSRRHMSRSAQKLRQVKNAVFSASRTWKSIKLTLTWAVTKFLWHLDLIQNENFVVQTE
ncbi:hypothetical protein CY34DRAFT_806846 [Suillus luteus UH-Slu-Lm8-n1]|uniref:Uncharacterized protein n=1 Tax=Suillus luteus UH-Slu-Lm8-n1 TaxID=930992 RepID=A0A0C9ZSJ2_9AGAM|nr:hypothetical protein CY34DRAFT_806846 [Suillus luteus UH-Slu-Lm8-n1]